jgi:hypothetical protein
MSYISQLASRVRGRERWAIALYIILLYTTVPFSGRGAGRGVAFPPLGSYEGAESLALCILCPEVMANYGGGNGPWVPATFLLIHNEVEGFLTMSRGGELGGHTKNNK